VTRLVNSRNKFRKKSDVTYTAIVFDTPGPGFYCMLLLAVSPKHRFWLVQSHTVKTDVFIAGLVWGESRDSEPFWRFEPFERATNEQVGPAFEICGDD
jgi:hypothetical protein